MHFLMQQATALQHQQQQQAVAWQQQHSQQQQQQQQQQQEHANTEPLHQCQQPASATDALQNVEIGIPADSQVAVACGYMTRAKQSLAHITLDELEQTLPLPEEKLLPLEDGEEYQYFLQVRMGASEGTLTGFVYSVLTQHMCLHCCLNIALFRMCKLLMENPTQPTKLSVIHPSLSVHACAPALSVA